MHKAKGAQKDLKKISMGSPSNNDEFSRTIEIGQVPNENTDEDETERETLKETNTTPDGGWGWIVVLGSFLIHFITDGILYSFGIFYIEFLAYYKGSKGETAWIGSLAAGFQLFSGPLASALTNKFGCRFTTIAGAIAVAAGFVLSIFSPNLYFLYFSFGILAGTGFGLTYLPAIIIVNNYFEKKRTFAVGVASCGSGIGAFILNPISKYLIDVYAWRGALLIQAGILLNCILCGALFRPLDKEEETVPRNSVLEAPGFTDVAASRSDKEMQMYVGNNDYGHASLSHSEQLSTSECKQRKQNVLKGEMRFDRTGKIVESYNKNNQQEPGVLVHDIFDESYQAETSLQPSDRDSKATALFAEVEKMDASYESVNDDAKKSAEMLCCGNVRTSIRHMNDACNVSPLKDVIFIMYLISNIFISLGVIVPFIFLYDSAVDHEIDTDSAKWLGSIIGITNTFGRVLSGLLADKLKVNRLLLFNISITICGISIALNPLCLNFTSLVLFACVFGLSYGIYIPLMSVVLVDLLGNEMLTNSFGLLLMLKGTANLIGPPVAGWLYDVTGSYEIPFIVSGITVATSGIMLLSVNYMKRYRENKKRSVPKESFETEKLTS